MSDALPSKELMPCPLCGHEAVLREDAVHGEYWGQWDRVLWCSSSHCRLRISLPADSLDVEGRLRRRWNCRPAHEPAPALDFVAALKIAEGVFEQYRQDQLRWWKKMDGTPILNDVAVRMAEAFRKAVSSDDTLMLRSVGAMAIAEGEEGWERVPIDCPMLAAVAKLRRDHDTLRAGPPPGVPRDGGLRDLMLAMRAYVNNYDCADAAELEAKAFIMSQCDALTKRVGCAKCGSTPLATERGRCEECGATVGEVDGR